MDNKTKYTRIIRIFLIFALTIFIFFLLKLLLQYPFFYSIKKGIINILIPFLLSFIIVYIFHPVLYWLEKNFSIKTWVSILVLITIYASLIILLINFILPLFGKQLKDILLDIPGYINEFEILIFRSKENISLLNHPEVINAINNTTDLISSKVSSLLVDFVINTTIFLFKSIWLMILIPIIIFIMMKDYNLIYEQVTKFLEKHRKKEWIQLLKNIDKKLGAYIRGELMIISYMFVGTLTMLTIIGMPNAFIFSLIIAFTNLIPYLGPYIGGIPLCTYAYFQSPQLLLASFIVILVMQQLDGGIGQPLVFGSQLKIHPLKVMVVMIIGGTSSGIIGIFMAVPIYIILSETFIFIRPKIKKVYIK